MISRPRVLRAQKSAAGTGWHGWLLLAFAMKRTKILIAISGILLPYLARIPGALIKGPVWITTFMDQGVGGFVFLGALNFIFWGSVLLSVTTYRHPRSAWFPVILGFAAPAICYGLVDLRSSSTAVLSMVFIPLYALPLVLIGWLAGLRYDRKAGLRNPSRQSE